MKAGIWIACIFAAVWGTVGTVALGVSAANAALLNIGISAVIIGLSFRRRWPRAEIQHGNPWKSVAIWSSVEGLGIFVAVNVLVRTGHPQLIVPVIAVIVGLHFFPLARGIPLRGFHVTGAALVIFGVSGILLPASTSIPLVAIGAAVTLWLTGIHLLSLGNPVGKSETDHNSFADSLD